MMHTGLAPELALATSQRAADERLVGFARRSRGTVRARVGRRLLVWGARLSPPERDPSRGTPWAATMVP